MRCLRTENGGSTQQISFGLGAVCTLKTEATRSIRAFAACTRKTEVTHNILYNNENKHHIGTSLTKGEQTFTRQDDVLRKPAEKG